MVGSACSRLQKLRTGCTLIFIAAAATFLSIVPGPGLSSAQVSENATGLDVTTPPGLPVSGALAQTGFEYGIKIEGEDMVRKDEIESYFRIARDLDVNIIKVVVGQDFYRPHDNTRSWTMPGGVNYDRIAELAQEYNMSIMPNFISVDYPFELQTDAEKFAEFVFAFIERYKKKMNIRYTEFQNEPATKNDGGGSDIKLPLSWRGTARDLVRGNNAAYDRIKASYPDIMVGSAGFLTDTERHFRLYSQGFYDAYFRAGPKFDFFALHHYPKDHSYVQGDKKELMPTGYYVFDSFRELLDKYGYAAKPIFVTEGFEDKPFEKENRIWDWTDPAEAAVFWLEGYVLTLSKAGEANIMGKIITYAKGNSSIALVGSSDNYKRNQYYMVKHLIYLFRKYPIYSGHISGNINSGTCWVEEFRNSSGGKMWTLFDPILYDVKPDLLLPGIAKKTQTYPQEVTLTVGSCNLVKITVVENNQVRSEQRKVSNGAIRIMVGRMPVFVEGL